MLSSRNTSTAKSSHAGPEWARCRSARSSVTARTGGPRQPNTEKVKANPALAACYAAAIKKTGWSLPAVTNRDFFHPPTVESIGLARFSGHAGDVIEVRARDDFFVKAVTVTLRDAAGTELESGPAAAEETYLPWKYRARTELNGKGPITVEAVAQDLPGNRTTRSEIWPGTTRAPAALTPATPSVVTKPLSTPPVNNWDPRAE